MSEPLDDDYQDALDNLTPEQEELLKKYEGESVFKTEFSKIPVEESDEME